jgi:hypothetical protein
MERNRLSGQSDGAGRLWLKQQDRDFQRPLNRILRLVMDLTRRVGRRRSAA